MLAWPSIDLRTDPDDAEHRGDPAELIDVAAFVAALAVRPAWMRDALCREHPELDWHPDRGEDQRPALAVCDRCLVRDECLASADGCGIWGGTSARERKRLGTAA